MDGIKGLMHVRQIIIAQSHTDPFVILSYLSLQICQGLPKILSTVFFYICFWRETVFLNSINSFISLINSIIIFLFFHLKSHVKAGF